MKFLVSVLLTALLGFVCSMYFPWWSIVAAAFIVAALTPQSAGRAFLSGALGIFLLWLTLCWTIDIANNSILSTKIASILPFGGSVFLLIIVTSVVGAIVGGFGALSAAYLRKLIRQNSAKATISLSLRFRNFVHQASVLKISLLWRHYITGFPKGS